MKILQLQQQQQLSGPAQAHYPQRVLRPMFCRSEQPLSQWASGPCVFISDPGGHICYGGVQLVHLPCTAMYSPGLCTVCTPHRHTPPQLVWRHGLGETTVTTVQS